jgi:class 3 adenylate cyclase
MVVGLRWFENYVPKKLVQRLMHQGDGGKAPSEARDVTVMFTDIVGFAAHSETMTAEATAKFLNEHFATVGHCIEDTGGTIDKFIGDAVMAFWGAPEAQPDHAARALTSALAIRGRAGRAPRRARPPRRSRGVRALDCRGVQIGVDSSVGIANVSTITVLLLKRARPSTTATTSS